MHAGYCFLRDKSPLADKTFRLAGDITIVPCRKTGIFSLAILVTPTRLLHLRDENLLPKIPVFSKTFAQRWKGVSPLAADGGP